MQANIFTLPVSLEQVAAVIKRMRPQDRQQLLAMVPELATDAIKQKGCLTMLSKSSSNSNRSF